MKSGLAIFSSICSRLPESALRHSSTQIQRVSSHAASDPESANILRRSIASSCVRVERFETKPLTASSISRSCGFRASRRAAAIKMSTDAGFGRIGALPIPSSDLTARSNSEGYARTAAMWFEIPTNRSRSAESNRCSCSYRTRSRPLSPGLSPSLPLSSGPSRQ